MDKVFNGLILVLGLLIGTFVMSFVFSNERPKHDKDFYKQLDEEDSSNNT